MAGRRFLLAEVLEAQTGTNRAEATGRGLAALRGDRDGGRGQALEVNQATLNCWRAQYGGMTVDAAKELRQLRDDNQRLKRIVADRELFIDMLKEISEVSGITITAMSCSPTPSIVDSVSSSERMGSLLTANDGDYDAYNL